MRSAQLDEIAHIALHLGRLLLENGAGTSRVQDAIARFAAAFGAEANLLVTYEALLVTIAIHDQFRTKIGHRVPGMNVGMSALHALDQLVDQAEHGQLTLSQARDALETVEHWPAGYPRWLVTLGLALTAASLSRLFGGDWGTFLIAGLAGAIQTWARLQPAIRRANPVLATFALALLGGTVGGVGVLLGASAMAPLCLVCPGMILVPGVPLINGVRDLIGSHASLGISRLGFAAVLVMAIAIGLFTATIVTGVRIPVAAPAAMIGVPQDALFSALAAAGYAVLFNVPPRIIWACMVCGVASHTLRTLLLHAGIDILAGTLIGALAVGILAHVFARYYQAPVVAFAFAGVVAMIPGVYAFRAVIASVQVAHGGAGASLIGDTLALLFTVLLMVAGIGVGIAAPALILTRWRPTSAPSSPPRGRDQNYDVAPPS